MTAVTSSGKAVVTLPEDTQILIVREFDAPKHLVYRAYTEPDLIKRWWSGERGEVVSAEVDLRVGGSWRYVMLANEGFEVAFHGTFREIVPNERLVTTEVFEGAPVEDEEKDAAVNFVTFEETDGRTTLTTLVECHTREVRDIIIESGMEGGMQEAMDKLEQVAISLG
ncbi:MAG: SRPBCC family protein [Actinomycetota bacterium]